METNFKEGGQIRVKPLGTILTTSESKSSSGRCVYTKKKKKKKESIGDKNKKEVKNKEK
jgi:hypothetical protein